MDEFNSLRSYPESLKLKDINPVKYDLMSLRKVNTKFGNSVTAKSDDEEKEYYLAKNMMSFLSRQ